MEHKWEIEEIDSGPSLGVNDFWVCHRCKASGGPSIWFGKDGPPTMPPFLAGTGVALGDDCDKAIEIVADYKAKAEKAIVAKIKRWHDMPDKSRQYLITRKKMTLSKYLMWTEAEYVTYKSEGKIPMHYPPRWYDYN